MTSGWDTYDRAAATYRAVRPSYPPQVFEEIGRYADRLPSEPSVLEIGAGTGQATAQMAERGWHVLGIEPGGDLAQNARADLSQFEAVEIRTVRFEDAELPDRSFDLVAAATAWHWVDPLIGIPKAARVLRRDGVIALWWNAHVTDTPDPKWAPIRRVYEDVAPHLAQLALTHLHAELERVVTSELGGVVTKPYNCVLVLGKTNDGTSVGRTVEDRHG